MIHGASHGRRMGSKYRPKDCDLDIQHSLTIG
jgi:hypothetical protein